MAPRLAAPERRAGARRASRAALFAAAALAGGGAFAAAAGVGGRVRADVPAPRPPPSIADRLVLAPDTYEPRVLSVETRLSAYNQFGAGYQSKSGPVAGPGSERLTVFEPQAAIVWTQGPRVTHRVWVPVDIVSAASPSSVPKPVDVVSGASRHNVGGTFQWATTYRKDAETDLAATTGFHLEEPFRSWNAGLGARRSLAGENTVVSASAAGILDWFDRFLVSGARDGRALRSSTLAAAGVTQVLSPTTIVNANYGITWQLGELGNTWNAVPLDDGTRGAEILPRARIRYALVGRASQFLPWNGALRLYYRFYADNWGIVAHSASIELLQRISPALYLGALTRVHTQTAADFFTILAHVDGRLRTADSDLASLQSATFGAKLVGDAPGGGVARSIHYEIEMDRYNRTNDLRIDMVSCAFGLRF